MKTRRYITGLLIILVLGIVSIQAQSARRTAPQQRNERAATARTTTKKATPQKAQKQQVQRSVASKSAVRQTAPQKVQKPKVQQPKVQRNTTSRSAVRQTTPQKAEPQVQRNTQSARQTQPQVQQQRTTQPARTPSSISTPNNPRSTYRQPVSNVDTREVRNLPTRVTQYSSRSYYGGNQYHYVYPTTRVKIHIHNDVYLHNYRVLYYPTYNHIFWTRRMYRDYVRWYPGYSWRYSYGYRINAISIFEARYNLGEVAMVYGRVYATWYNAETDDYLLFFGGDYPNHQFTVVLPGRIARRFSWRPETYFLGEHITVTGLITTFDGVPEIIVKNKQQLGLY